MVSPGVAVTHALRRLRPGDAGITRGVGDAPDTPPLKRDRDLVGFYRGAIWFRRCVVAILTLISVLALANVFGQWASIDAGRIT